MEPKSYRILPDDFDGQAIADPTKRLMVRISLATGIRISELLGLKVSDLVAADGTTMRELFPVPITKKGAAKCKRDQNGTRLVPLPPPTAKEIAEYLNFMHLTTGDWLFKSPAKRGHHDRNEHYTKQYVSNWWRAWQVEHGFMEPWNWHDMRHTCATRLLESGFTLTEVQMILGHRSPSTTARYLHPSLDRLSEKIKKFYAQKEEPCKELCSTPATENKTPDASMGG